MNDSWNIQAQQTFCDDIFAQAHNDGRDICPPREQVFAALEHIDVADVRVLILGQDPYPTAGDAHGLAFSVAHGKAPRSLKNMFTELHADYPEHALRTHANLSDWSTQGVLLLNTVLTVPAGAANGHARIGWQKITTAFLHHVAIHSPYTVWMLWGNAAQKSAHNIIPTHHDTLACGHPSPLAYNQKRPNGFKNCGHFKRCNELLNNNGYDAINWSGH